MIRFEEDHLSLLISIASTSFVFASTNESFERNALNTGVSFTNPESDPYNDFINAKKEAGLKASIMAAKETGAKDIETVSVICPTRPQITHYWAGLAAAEQVIRANGNSNNLTATYGSVADGAGGTVSGTYHQFTINSWLGGVGTGGASMYQVTTAINHFSTGSFTWGYRHVDGSGTTCANNLLPFFRSTIRDNQKCCVVLVSTQHLGYYYGNACDHYITVNGYCSVSSTVSSYFDVVDPHYSSSYQGPHTISPAELGNAVSYTGYNLIW